MLEEQVYHLYPLGFGSISKIEDQIPPHFLDLGITCLLLGPVFESESHGYDTVDYKKVDPRIGNNEDLRRLVEICHKNNIKVMLDCVFNHISRSHSIFKDLKSKREASVM